MRTKIFFGFLSISMLAHAELSTVKQVDLKRYAGHWYEIARLPDALETNCVESTADYTLHKDGSLAVLNHCLKANGFHKETKALAQVENKPQNSKLKVHFAPKWIRWTGMGVTDYWIIDLDPNYEFAVISEPGQRHLWILSRTTTLKETTYQEILSKLKNQHFDLSHLIENNLSSSLALSG